MTTEKPQQCELRFAVTIDRVIVCPNEDRHPSDPKTWIIGFRGYKPGRQDIGLSPRWINRFWRIEPLIPTKDTAMVALVERATLAGFTVIEVFSISPPHSKPKQRELMELNERISRMIRGDGNHEREGEPKQGMADLAISGTV